MRSAQCESESTAMKKTCLLEFLTVGAHCASPNSPLGQVLRPQRARQCSWTEAEKRTTVRKLQNPYGSLSYEGVQLATRLLTQGCKRALSGPVLGLSQRLKHELQTSARRPVHVSEFL